MILSLFRSQGISKSAYINACLFNTENQSPRQPKFTLLSGCHIGVPRMYTNMVFSYWAPIFCKTFRRISEVLGKCTGLKLGQVSYLVNIFYKITIFLAFSTGFFQSIFYCTTLEIDIVQFQKISMLPPEKGLEFPEGWGSQKKSLPGGRYGYCLELHIECFNFQSLISFPGPCALNTEDK